MVEVTFRIVDARGVSPWNDTVGGSDGVPTGGALYEAARTMLRACRFKTVSCGGR